jgi:hypothetical protein
MTQPRTLAEQTCAPVQPVMATNLHRGDLGEQRARIAKLLTGEDLAGLFALADFCISCGGSVAFGKLSDLIKRLIALRLIETFRPPEPPHLRSVRLTKLGWLTLLTRAETEMRHLLPMEEIQDAE